VTAATPSPRSRHGAATRTTRLEPLGLRPLELVCGFDDGDLVCGALRFQEAVRATMVDPFVGRCHRRRFAARPRANVAPGHGYAVIDA
jgi:hypothetical protein